MNPLILTLGLLAAAAAQPAAQPPAATSRLIAIAAPQATGKMDPALAAALPYLVEAALESDLGWEAVPGGSAGRKLTLELAGQGPWKLSARCMDDATGKSIKVAAETPFSSVDNAMQAAGELAGALEHKLSGRQPAAAAPQTHALSSSAQALAAYAQGRQSIRTGSVPAGLDLMGKALLADPSFTLAAAETALAHLVSGDVQAARAAVSGLAAAPPAGEPPLAAALRAGLAALLRDDAQGTIAAAQQIVDKNPDLVWGRVLMGAGQSLAKARPEALAAWSAAAGVDPADPRLTMGLGLAALAAGDLAKAAGAFATARSGWPQCLRAWSLQAESQARQRDVPAARETLTAMKAWMDQNGVKPASEAQYPDLMLGSLDLMEGRFRAAMKYFEALSADIDQRGDTAMPTGTMLQALVDLRCDLINSSDEITRGVQMADARRAIANYKSWLGPRAAESQHVTELMRLDGLVQLKNADTAGAWKTVDQIKSTPSQPADMAYDAAHLSAMVFIREGDPLSAIPMLQLAFNARGTIEDQMDLARAQFRARKLADARATLDQLEQRLTSWNGSGMDGLILPQPIIAGMIPVFYYVRASLAYDESKPEESRRYFSMMLRYLREPDRELYLLAKEAWERGARPL